MSRVKEIDTKNCTSYFFEHIINVKSLDLSNTLLDEKSDKIVLINYSTYLTPNSVKTFVPYYQQYK